MTKGIDWTSEMIHELKRLMGLDENLSFQVIAKRMSETFGVTFTRNSMVGKAHRLRMPPRPPREYVIQPHSDRMMTLRPPSQRSAPNRRRDGKVQLVDLNYGACKWPSGTGPYLFCGKPVHDDRQYCLTHCRLAYQKPEKTWS
jgi:GcrA cell cycle regulator